MKPKAILVFLLIVLGGSVAGAYSIQQSSLVEQRWGVISGRVTIGPLCPVEPCPNPQPDIYSSREIILQPVVGEPVHIRLNPDGGFQARVKAVTYTLTLTDCEFLGCGNALPKTVTVEPDKTTRVEIDIDTGIR